MLKYYLEITSPTSNKLLFRGTIKIENRLRYCEYHGVNETRFYIK